MFFNQRCTDDKVWPMSVSDINIAADNPYLPIFYISYIYFTTLLTH